jgi:tocopherol cyclase
MKVFKREVFQGSLTKKNYFEGWYFKHISHDKKSVYAFIPGVSLAANNAHSFIQIINGVTGETHYISYDINDFIWEKEDLWVKVGNSVFTDKFIDIDIEDKSIRVSGRLEYSNMVKYPKTILSPSIMGWYSYIPFMECNHGIVSVNHSLDGVLNFNGNSVDFGGGKGYIEKDWGTSFPEAWIWLHSNTFNTENASLFVSVAKIPWLGRFFMGFICFLYVDGKFYRFSTYNNSKILSITYEDRVLSIRLENNLYVLNVVATHQRSGVLKAPSFGEMNRHIKESIDSTVHIQLFDKSNRMIFEDNGVRAGLEIIEEIFKYFK